MSQSTEQTSKKLKLQALFTTVLVVPFVLQILVMVGLIGWLSLRSGERAVNQVATQLRDETANRIYDQLEDYLKVPHRINQANIDSARLGELDFSNIRRVEQRFWRQIQLYDSLSSIGFGSVRGTYVAGDRRGDILRVGHKDETSPDGTLQMFEVDREGNPTLRLGYQGRPNYDPRQRPWYQLGQSSREGRWTEIFTYSAQPIYVISAVRAAYNQSNIFQGVFITDLMLSDISGFLQSLEIGKSGEAFILERSGKLVAASTPDTPYRVVDGKAERLAAIESKAPLVRATATYLSQQFVSLNKIQQTQQLDFNFNQERHFIEVVPYRDPRGLDWLIVVVIPESDFMGEIYQTARSTGFLVALALAIAIAIGLLTARWLVRPIVRLSAAATVLAQGAWDSPLPIERRDELGVLAEAFNRIAQQLKESLIAIKQREAKLSEAQRVAHIGSWDFDRTTQSMTWSEEMFRIHGLDLHEVTPIYPDSLRLVHSADIKSVRHAVESSIHQACPFEIDYRIVQPTGEIRYVCAKGEVTQNSAQQVVRLFGTVLDITERKQVELERDRLLELEQAARAEAESANQAKDRFLAVLSHELRTPLNPILGWTQLLQAGRLDRAQSIKALETIERNVKLQAQLIDDLLDVSRILRGKLSLNLQSVNLALAIAAALETTRLTAEAKAIQIETHFEPFPIYVKGDLTRLQQIVWNLLSNAIKFTPTGGRVTITLSTPAPLDSAQITITDTGHGIASDCLPHLFDDFWQADNTSTRSAGGLGLGLAIARHLVYLHQGAIAVTSPGLGLGATFTVTLPLLRYSSGSAPHQAIAPGRAQANDPLQGVRLLLVDDEPDNLDFLALLLADQGATVTTATTAAEALEHTVAQLPDVLISDISMPDIDGYDLIRRVRSQFPAPTCNLPAIALTAHAGAVNQQHALAAGFQAHLTKPIEPACLITTILKLIEANKALANKL